MDTPSGRLVSRSALRIRYTYPVNLVDMFTHRNRLIRAFGFHISQLMHFLVINSAIRKLSNNTNRAGIIRAFFTQTSFFTTLRYDEYVLVPVPDPAESAQEQQIR